jgi:hypothetical protein
MKDVEWCVFIDIAAHGQCITTTELKEETRKLGEYSDGTRRNGSEPAAEITQSHAMTVMRARDDTERAHNEHDPSIKMGFTQTGLLFFA